MPKEQQERSVRKLNFIRNNFIHFVSKSWSLEVSGLPEIASDCLIMIEFLGWDSGNVLWHDEIIEERAKIALDLARYHLNVISETYKSCVT